MKYKVGDKVIVREDLEVGNFYGHYFNKEMAELKGKVVTIEEVSGYFYCIKELAYCIKELDYFWTEKMFSGLAEPRNLIPLIAKELGVEIGEEFKISNKPDVYKFTEDRLIGIESDGTYNTCNTFYDLINGKEKIIKLPPKQKLTEAERVILENLPKEYTHIQRYKYDLIVYDDDGTDIKYLNMFSHLFQFIKWEDKEPYNIEELLEEYENLRSE